MAARIVARDFSEKSAFGRFDSLRLGAKGRRRRTPFSAAADSSAHP